jgi:methionyl-tRNA formyltransferase
MRIVFMGTPSFAVATLDKLVKAGYEIVAVVTAPDKVQGRGMKDVRFSEVKQYALEHDLLLLQPEKLRDPAFFEVLSALKPDLGVIVAFRMLPVAIWSLPRLGTFNVHGSLLPKYRGAAPIHWAVISGETKTGVTTFQLKHEIDTGDLLLQAQTEIGTDDTTGEVYDRLMHIGADLALETVKSYENQTLLPKLQDETKACPAPKLHLDNTEIKFDQPMASCHNLVRGLQPFPTAWTRMNGGILKIHQSKLTDLPSQNQNIGQLYTADKRLLVNCSDFALEILQLQPEGRKRMSATDFINGQPKNAWPIQLG